MKLRFFAREDALATVPGAVVALGQPIQRVGREFVPPKDGKPGSMPATKDAHEVDIAEGTPAGVQTFEAYRRLAGLGDVWCADEATAQALGASFVPVEFKDGAWLKKPADPKPARKESDK